MIQMTPFALTRFQAERLIVDRMISIRMLDRPFHFILFVILNCSVKVSPANFDRCTDYFPNAESQEIHDGMPSGSTDGLLVPAFKYKDIRSFIVGEQGFGRLTKVENHYVRLCPSSSAPILGSGLPDIAIPTEQPARKRLGTECIRRGLRCTCSHAFAHDRCSFRCKGVPTRKLQSTQAPVFVLHRRSG